MPQVYLEHTTRDPQGLGLWSHSSGSQLECQDTPKHTKTELKTNAGPLLLLNCRGVSSALGAMCVHFSDPPG